MRPEVTRNVCVCLAARRQQAQARTRPLYSANHSLIQQLKGSSSSVAEALLRESFKTRLLILFHSRQQKQAKKRLSADQAPSLKRALQSAGYIVIPWRISTAGTRSATCGPKRTTKWQTNLTTISTEMRLPRNSKRMRRKRRTTLVVTSP